MKQYLALALTLALALLLAITAGYHVFTTPPVSEAQLGAVYPIGTTQFYLAGAGATAAASTITLTNFETPDGRPITMSMLGTIGYAAIEPGTSKLENITFSGVSQNANGTAALTGVTRGNDFVTPYAASTTLAKAHAGGATLILTNTAGFYTQFMPLNNNATSSAILVFASTSPPRYDFPAAQAAGSYISTTSELASIAYVNTVALSGAPNASESVKGIVQLGTQLQSASSSNLGSTGASLVQQTQYATSSPGTAGLWDVWTNNLGKITQSFLDLTASFIFSTTTQYSANVGSLTATTSAVLNNVTITGTASGSGFYNQLISTTTTAAMTYATTSTLTAYNNLRVIVSSPTLPRDSLCMAFNSDFGTNYGSIGFKNDLVQDIGNGIGTNASAARSLVIGNDANGTTTDMYAVTDILNQTAVRKQVVFQASMSDSGSHAPLFSDGAGVWNNTSNQITQIIITTNGGSNCTTPGTLSTGTTIQVYGYN